MDNGTDRDDKDNKSGAEDVAIDDAEEVSEEIIEENNEEDEMSVDGAMDEKKVEAGGSDDE